MIASAPAVPARRALLALALSCALCVLAFASLASPQSLARADSDWIIYDDALRNSFQDWGWASRSFTNTSPVYSGANSISVSYAGDYDGLWLVNPGAGVDTSGFAAMRFAIHGGGAGGQLLSVKAGSGTDYPTNFVQLNTYLPGGPVANAWRVITIPLSALNLQNTVLNNLAFQSEVSSAQPTFYLDDIRLVAGAAPPPDALTATIRIDAGGSITPIDARLLGSNLPAWLGPTGFSNATLRARTIGSGATVLRMPGGSWSNSYNWLECENGVSPCDWASRPTDFINFLRATGNAGMYTVNVNGTSKEAAAAVAFFNASVTDTTAIGVDIRGVNWYTAGHWAQLRAAHGNPQPLGIQLWEVGNEVYGGMPSSGGGQCAMWGWEDVWTCDGAEYVNGIGSGSARHEGYLEFRAAMRAVDPTVKVGAVGVPDPGSWSNWGNEVIAAAGAALDFYVVHEYAYFDPPANLADALAVPHTTWRAMLNNLNAAFDTYAGGRRAPIAVTEYNLFSSWDRDNGQLMTRAVNLLFIADTLGQIMQNGFALANQWDLSNGGPSANGTDYGLLSGSASAFARSPQYYAFPLWARFGTQRLPVTSTVSAASTLSVYAGRVNPSTLSLLAINKTGSSLTATIQVQGVSAIVGGSADVAQADSLATTAVTFNGVSNPSNDLSNAPPAALTGVGNPFTHVFPPYSVTLLRMNTLAPNLSRRVYLPLILNVYQ
ncbi:MAG TPA: alpha-L-arabinofuranosidase [Anaerolineae bacterium]|nr:alpha-L-arabinofuranosidase [Anaerolineae bacterium]